MEKYIINYQHGFLLTEAKVFKTVNMIFLLSEINTLHYLGVFESKAFPKFSLRSLVNYWHDINRMEFNQRLIFRFELAKIRKEDLNGGLIIKNGLEKA